MAAGQPFAVEIDLAVDQLERQRPVRDCFEHPRAMGIQHLLSLLERAASLLDQCSVRAHFGDRHAGATQPVHQIEPVDVVLVVDAPPTGIAHHAWYEALRLIPADGVHGAPRSGGEFADAQVRRGGRDQGSAHTSIVAGSPSALIARSVSMYSTSSVSLPSRTV